MFVHPVVERHVELRPLLNVTREAEFRLRLNQQILFGFRMVDRVAGNTAHVTQAMHRFGKVHLVRARSVAGEAAGVDVLGGRLVKCEREL
jgi:hypothetical protein